MYKCHTTKQQQQQQQQLENVAIANALQLEAARRHAVPIRFNFVARASLTSLSLSVAVLSSVFTAYTLCYAVTLNFDPVTVTFDLELCTSATSAVVCHIIVPNFMANWSTYG